MCRGIYRRRQARDGSLCGLDDHRRIRHGGIFIMEIDMRHYVERTDAIKAHTEAVKEQTQEMIKLTLALERGNHFR